jgi:hypothetical protein
LKKEYKINKKVIAKGTAAIVVYAIVIIDIIIQCTTSALPLFWQRSFKAVGNRQKFLITLC